MSDLEQNKALMRSFLEALGRGDGATVLDIYADDAIIETKGNTLISGTRTKADAVAGLGALAEMFPDGIEFTILSMTAEDDRVLAEAVSHGRHVSGRLYNNEYVFVARVRDGRFVEYREYLDTEHTTDVLFGGQHSIPA